MTRRGGIPGMKRPAAAAPAAELLVPAFDYGFGRHANGHLVITISNAGMTIVLPFDRLAFAGFVRDANRALELNADANGNGAAA